jgi:sugar phosphate permease
VASKTSKRLTYLRYGGIALVLLGILGIAVEYHNIARCSVSAASSSTRGGCALVLNLEGASYAFMIAGAVMVLISLIANAFMNDDPQ